MTVDRRVHLRRTTGVRRPGVVVGARAGQPDRRAHRLQRRLRAAVRDRGHGPTWQRGVRDDGVLRMRSVQQHTGDVSIDLADIEPGKPDGWAALRRRRRLGGLRPAGHDVRGMDLLVDGRVPLGSGLSSSHALECAVALAMNDLFGLGLRRERARRGSAHTAENDFVGAPTGHDGPAARRCAAPRVTRCSWTTARSRPSRCRSTPRPTDLALLVVDTRVHHGNADGAYGDRRARASSAAELLGVAALRDVSVAGPGRRPGPARRRRAAPPGPARRDRERPRGRRDCQRAARAGTGRRWAR